MGERASEEVLGIRLVLVHDSLFSAATPASRDATNMLFLHASPCTRRNAMRAAMPLLSVAMCNAMLELRTQ